MTTTIEETKPLESLRIEAEFLRQRWVGDTAEEIGREQVDVSAALSGLTHEQVQELRDNDYSTDDLVDTDALGHDGPFEVTVTDAICESLGVNDVDEITAAIWSKAQDRLAAGLPYPEEAKSFTYAP